MRWWSLRRCVEGAWEDELACWGIDRRVGKWGRAYGLVSTECRDGGVLVPKELVMFI